MTLFRVVTLLIQVFLDRSVVNLENEPLGPEGSWGGFAEATVLATEGDSMQADATLPCHVELVPKERVEGWANECPDLYDWLGWSDGIYTVEIRGKKYVLFITPFAR